jgi:hypothetical protein
MILKKTSNISVHGPKSKPKKAENVLPCPVCREDMPKELWNIQTLLKVGNNQKLLICSSYPQTDKLNYTTYYQSMTCDVRLQLAEVQCAVASCDVGAELILVVTCDVRACSAF